MIKRFWCAVQMTQQNLWMDEDGAKYKVGIRGIQWY